MTAQGWVLLAAGVGIGAVTVSWAGMARERRRDDRIATAMLRHPATWDGDDTVVVFPSVRAAYIERVRVQFYEDASNCLRALRDGRIDLATSIREMAAILNGAQFILGNAPDDGPKGGAA